MPRQRPAPDQRSLDDLGTPLADVTFCVIDLETTGGSPTSCLITEIGAVKLRGGECLGTFQTLVNPGCAIPPEITVITGISEAMVMRAPRIEQVLGSLTDFIGDAVIVGHNIRFDLGFLAAAFERDHRTRLANVSIDTVALARRLLRDEVPNCRLGTLAERLRLDHRPSHRALDDALATGDLLHVLIERAGRLGVSGLDDLRMLTRLAGSAQISKLRLTERLPRSPGVYLFRDGRGEVLYVGKATNLRSRVRSYFSSDDRRKVAPMLRETERIDHKRCANELEASVLEIRLIHLLAPRYNREHNRWRSSVYLKLTLAERYPRLSIVRDPRADGGLYLGPLPSRKMATLVMEAIHTVAPLRRCGDRRPAGRTGPCTAAQLGVSMCVCTGSVDPAAYREVVATVVRGLTVEPQVLLEPLRDRMMRLAGEQRFEEAALTRDRSSALDGALRRQSGFDRLRRSERIEVRFADGSGAVLARGRLTALWEPPDDVAQPRLGDEWGVRPVEAVPADPGPPEDGPLPRDLADELWHTARWLERNAARLQLVESGAA